MNRRFSKAIVSLFSKETSWGSLLPHWTLLDIFSAKNKLNFEKRTTVIVMIFRRYVGPSTGWLVGRLVDWSVSPLFTFSAFLSFFEHTTSAQMP